jgi:single-stranded-DNA-specific exonuclease
MKLAAAGPRTAPPPTRWVLEPQPAPETAAALAAATRLPGALAALLLQRGHANPDAVRRFLKPSLDDLSDPYALAGMREAVAIIVDAIRRGVVIGVHGDYDVDGQCSTAILTRTLRLAGATVVPFIPHRMRDGYDFGMSGLDAARAAGVGLILTCDCGITAVEPVSAARAAGLEVVVTDHHLPAAALPPASAIVNPQQPGDTSGLKMLCGAGIAFMLVRALVPALGLPQHLPLHLLDYVALATVADVVPLVGDNRIIVRQGLKVLNRTRWAGLRALVQQAGLAGKEIRAGHVGYILGPRLNAVGRIDEPMEGLRLLLTDDPGEAELLARKLETLNNERQQLDQRMLEEALQQAEAQGGSEAMAFVLSSESVDETTKEGWHAGVVGIVASRVVERYGRPTFLVAIDRESGLGRGSGRSISAFDLHGALHACGDLLERFGGHRMAAGLTMHRDRIAAFRERLSALVAGQLSPDELGPEQRVDLVIGLHEATPELEQLLGLLEPCGMGNAAPVLGVRDVTLANWKLIPAREPKHLRGELVDGRTRLPCIGFGWADRLPAGWRPGAPVLVDAAFRLEIDTFTGTPILQARLCALAPARSPG